MTTTRSGPHDFSQFPEVYFDHRPRAFRAAALMAVTTFEAILGGVCMIDRFEDMLADWCAIHRVRLIVRLLERYADDFERNDSLDVRARQFAYYARKGLRL
jgi:hypothetical protein